MHEAGRLFQAPVSRARKLAGVPQRSRKPRATFAAHAQEQNWSANRAPGPKGSGDKPPRLPRSAGLQTRTFRLPAQNNPGRQIPCDTSPISRMEVVRAPTPKQRGRCGLDAMRIDPGDGESQQLRGEKRNSKVPDEALGFVCASTGNGDQALKRVIGFPALRRSVLAERAAPILVWSVLQSRLLKRMATRAAH